MLSRFDLIFSLKDKPNREKDTQIAEHILQTHIAAAVNRARKKDPDFKPTDVQLETERSLSPPIEVDLLRKYVAHAKNSCFPIITAEAAKAIGSYYIDKRNERADDGDSQPVPLTARQLEAFIRLAEASARIRLSPDVEKQDVKRATGIVSEYLNRIAGTEDGSWDIDKIASGTSHSQRSRLRVIRSIIDDLAALQGSKGNIEEKDIYEEAAKRSISRDKTEQVIERLYITDGYIYKTSAGFFRLARS